MWGRGGARDVLGAWPAARESPYIGLGRAGLVGRHAGGRGQQRRGVRVGVGGEFAEHLRAKPWTHIYHVRAFPRGHVPHVR